MANRALIFAVTLVASSLSHAYYAGAIPPAGWAPAVANAEMATMRASFAAGNELAWVGSALRGNAALNLGGNVAKLPFAATLAKTLAPKMLAGRLAAAMLGGPVGLVALGITAVQIATDPDFQAWIGDRFSYSPATNTWTQKFDGINTYWTVPAFAGDSSIHYGSKAAACASTGYPLNGDPRGMCGGWQFGVYEHTEMTGSQREADFTNDVLPALQARPIPDGLIPKVPGMDWPMNPPFVNMPPGFVIPCDDPKFCWDFKAGARPPSTYTPSGDPIPLGTTPETYRQPYVEVTPAPSETDPWRVDVKPKSVESTNPDRMTDPQVDPSKAKASAPAGSASAPKSSDTAPGLCEQFPDILACQTLDKVDPVDISNTNINVAITPDSGWGPATGSCPAPRVLALHGVNAEFSWQPFCDFASGVRGVILAVAWLIAAGSVIGMARRAD